jgi:hypothetical protein
MSLDTSTMARPWSEKRSNHKEGQYGGQKNDLHSDLCALAYLGVDGLGNLTGIGCGHVGGFGNAVDNGCEGVVLIVPENTAELHVFQVGCFASNVTCLDGVPLDLLLAHSRGIHIFGAGRHCVNDKIEDRGNGVTYRLCDFGWVL